MRKSQERSGSRLLRAGLAAAATAAIVVAGTPMPASAASAPLTLSSTAGPTVGGNTITASSTTAAAFLSGVTSPTVTFSIPACQQTYNTAAATAVTPAGTAGNVVGQATIRKITNTKAAISVTTGAPALPTNSATATSTRYNVCVYGAASAGAALVGNATYTVAAAPVFPANNVSPSSGPALGGTKIIVTATSGLPTTANSITATLGGSPLTQVTPINATSFSAVTPAHAAGLVDLVVTTAAGSKAITGAFTYANGIEIEPNTAPRTSTAQVVDVMGAGFNSYTFGSTATTARVWLVDGTYDPGATAGTPATAYVVGPIAECTGVTVISDNELICTLNLNAGRLTPTTAASAGAGALGIVPNGAYTLTVVSRGGVAQSDQTGYEQTDVSSGSTFTVAPY